MVQSLSICISNDWLLFMHGAKQFNWFGPFKSLISIETDMEVDKEQDAEMSAASERQFDCVICGQTSSSTIDRPFGVAVLLQPSTGMRNLSNH